MIEYSISPENRDVAQARFRETGGLPPAGATMLGRWHRLSGHAGYVLCESDDAVAVGKWMQDWTDVLTFEVVPVGDDASSPRSSGANAPHDRGQRVQRARRYMFRWVRIGAE